MADGMAANRRPWATFDFRNALESHRLTDQGQSALRREGADEGAF